MAHAAQLDENGKYYINPDMPDPMEGVDEIRFDNRSQAAVVQVLEESVQMFLDKNRKYGNSALQPLRVFSKAPTDEQIRVRMDDKISRIRMSADDDDEDPYMDLMVYLAMLIAKRREKKK